MKVNGLNQLTWHSIWCVITCYYFGCRYRRARGPCVEICHSGQYSGLSSLHRHVLWGCTNCTSGSRTQTSWYIIYWIITSWKYLTSIMTHPLTSKNPKFLCHTSLFNVHPIAHLPAKCPWVLLLWNVRYIQKLLVRWVTFSSHNVVVVIRWHECVVDGDAPVEPGRPVCGDHCDPHGGTHSGGGRGGTPSEMYWWPQRQVITLTHLEGTRMLNCI